MYKVADKNQIDKGISVEWLRENRDNVLIVSDFGYMESYTGKSYENFCSTFDGLVNFPGQYLKMKDNARLMKLTFREKLVPIKLIDMEMTRDWIESLPHLGNSRHQEHFKEIARLNGEIAKETLESIQQTVPAYRATLEMMGQELEQYIDKNSGGGLVRFTDAHRVKFIDLALHLAAEYDDHYKTDRYKKRNKCVNGFAFRFCCAGLMMVITRSALGVPRDISDKKLRNDLIDANYLACSTYWDGLLTRDDVLKKVESNLMGLLKAS